LTPTLAPKAPSTPRAAYEIKHDGFRFICRLDGDRVRLFSRGGHDWSRQLPAIVEAVRALPISSATLGGEVVICGRDACRTSR
jgi:bifunctional non-homologous end joining protein LigD